MVSKAGRAVRLVDRINSKLRKKPAGKSNFQLCLSRTLSGQMSGIPSTERRKRFKAAAKGCRGTFGSREGVIEATKGRFQ